ncbi:MAG TPA: serine/threonine-protein kinase, partial [Chthoniobacterales bacterium]
MMDSAEEDETSQREAIFYEALQISDPAEREAFLEQSCPADSSMRAAVDAMLAAHDQADTFLTESDPAMKPPPDLDESTSACSYTDASVGSWIGLYKLVQWLGEGGGGVVYLAEQEEPVQRQVALKIIKLGMDTRRVIARFEAERQVLALMNHPNIAHVLDAGATETGRPFFVMELVHGVRITDYCVLNRLPLRQRLELFQQVCLAIQHAHQKGVIHRDIKPSNILITLRDGVPVPKIIDFGIAKATTGRLSERTVYTGAEQVIGTPAYMSPEQVLGSGVDVDTRSDIYSLGVVLYELLTS